MNITLRIIEKSSYFIFFILVICFCNYINYADAESCDTTNLTFDRKEVIDVLKEGKFSNILSDDVRLTKLGYIKVMDSCLAIYIYVNTSESDGGPIGTQHMAKRLLVLSNSKYLGMYAIDELPIRINGNSVEFPGDEKFGNKIIFDSAIPPEQIYLDGEERHLYK